MTGWQQLRNLYRNQTIYTFHDVLGFRYTTDNRGFFTVIIVTASKNTQTIVPPLSTIGYHLPIQEYSVGFFYEYYLYDMRSVVIDLNNLYDLTNFTTDQINTRYIMGLFDRNNVTPSRLENAYISVVNGMARVYT